MRKIALIAAPMLLTACQQSMSERQEEGLARMDSAELNSYFSEDREGTFTNRDGTTGQIAYYADGTSYVRVGSDFQNEGEWRVQDDRFCAKWQGREEMCFPVVRVDANTLEVYNNNGSLRSTLRF